MKVLVVDDSALMRRWLKQCMEEIDAEVDLARNGKDALARIAAFDPDVVTLDINMPEMDGLTCLSHIMTDHPCPVVMLSSLTSKGAMATIEALELGAVDYFEKPDGTVSHALKESFGEIQVKVKAAAKARLRRAAPEEPKQTQVEKAPRKGRLKKRIKLVMFGVSTGGPGTIEQVLGHTSPRLDAPILIAVHMPNRFVDPFAQRLETKLERSIKPLARSTRLRPGEVVIAGADSDVLVSARGGELLARQAPCEAGRTWHPSVNRMVESALATFSADELLAVQLTGMGNDGVAAMTELKKNGGCTIAESEESAVIFGMPRELIEAGGAVHVLPSHSIGNEINALVGTG